MPVPRVNMVLDVPLGVQKPAPPTKILGALVRACKELAPIAKEVTQDVVQANLIMDAKEGLVLHLVIDTSPKKEKGDDSLEGS